MALSQPLFSFLRPLGPPRPSTFRQFLRFSTGARLRVEGPSTPSSSQEASRAADLAATEAATDADSAQSPAPKPVLPSERLEVKAHTSTQSTDSTLNPQTRLPYYIARSFNKNLPVYTDYKRGGNLHQTIVRKCQGDLQVLRDELRNHLKKDDKDVKINDLTKQIVIKGHHKIEVMQYLASKGL